MITDKIRVIEAKGHTKGNSIVIVEDTDHHYMLHGDVTYSDEALYENKLSCFYENVEASRETLDRVRAFIRKSRSTSPTHTPRGMRIWRTSGW